MTNFIAFQLNVVPPRSTHQMRQRLYTVGGKARMYTSRTNKAAVESQTLLELIRPHRPAEPMTGPLRLCVSWYYPYRKSEPKKNRTEDLWCDTRPDCDNLTKGLCNILTTLQFWGNDSQVANLQFKKKWVETPRIEILIRKLT